MGELKKGQIFKNWRELCGFMGWDIHGGTYKKSRLKELDTLCTYHKEGNKIIIDDVKPQDKVIVTSKNDNRSIFKNDLVYLIVHVLSRKLDETSRVLIATKNDFYSVIGLINGDYKDNYKDIQCYSLDNNIPYDCAYDLFINSQAKLKSMVKSSLDDLKNRGFLDWKMATIVKDIEGDTRLATLQEEETIVEAKAKARKDLKLGNRTINSIKKSGKYERYLKRVSKYTKKIGIEYSYEGYKIICSVDFKSILLSEQDVFLHLDSYRELMSNSMKEFGEKKVEKTLKRIQELTTKKEPTKLNPHGAIKPANIMEANWLLEQIGDRDNPYHSKNWTLDNIY